MGAAVGRALPAIAKAVDAIASTLARGGRLIYIGAGTSGRLASLDAAEIPPTFGVPARKVRAVIAGGRRALRHAVEGAEDRRAQGRRDLAKVHLSGNDVVVGITASGSTPYVLGGLEFARNRDAVTVGVTSNPGTPVTRLAQISIVTETGPEAITGSTRLKAGTTQKMVLNMLSTAAMIRAGRVYDNWMIGVAMNNRKLQARGIRILAEAAAASVDSATRALRQSGHDLRVALIMLKAGVTPEEARQQLRTAHGNLRAALVAKQARRGR